MELWDLYDRDRQPLLRTHRRGEKKNPGEYHIVVEVWTFNRDGHVLVTLRDPCKEMYPDKWENTGGSALAGETSRQAAVRELAEETGIVAAEEELTFLGTFREEEEFHDTYILRRDVPIDQLTMQKGETVAAKWVTMEQLNAMAADETLALPIGKRLNQIRQEMERTLACE